MLTLRQAKKGGFKDCLPEDLLAAVFQETLKRSKVDPSKIESAVRVRSVSIFS